MAFRIYNKLLKLFLNNNSKIYLSINTSAGLIQLLRTLEKEIKRLERRYRINMNITNKKDFNLVELQNRRKERDSFRFSKIKNLKKLLN